MSNGADGNARTDRGAEFTPDQRIWLLERDLDKITNAWKEEIQALRKTLKGFSAAFVSILMLLVSALALLVIQGR